MSDRERIQELEEFTRRVLNWKFDGDISIHSRFGDPEVGTSYYLEDQIKSAQSEALALLEPRG